MIITIDGLDGVGKSTLAKNIAKELDYEYIDKPIYKLFNVKGDDNYLYSEITHIQELIYNNTESNTLKSYFTGLSLLYIRECLPNKNIVIDRGILSAYAFNGDSNSKAVFELLIKLGVFFDLSIYLTANNNTRLKRLKNRNKHDPDLLNNKILSLSDNHVYDYINQHSELSCYFIDTNNKSKEEVFIEALNIIKRELKEKKAISYRKKD